VNLLASLSKRSVAEAIAVTDHKFGPNRQEFLKGCRIWNGLNNITGSRADIKYPRMSKICL
jgi:hypothetical protein